MVATRTGNERMVYFFTVIAIITLAIALMSYINLSTVRSLDRAKEVGIRKVVGAQKFHLRLQFFMEAVLMNTTALILAVVIIVLLTPTFNSIFETNFSWTSWFNQSFLLVLAAVFFSGVFLSGSYPAFVLSSFVPIAALKTKVGSFTSRSLLRRFFVVLQYGPAITLIICTMVVYGQLNFMQSMDVGLEMDNLITIRSARFLPEGMRSRDAEAVFKNEVKGLSNVAAASYAGNQAGRGLNFLVPFRLDSAGEAGEIEFKGTGVDHDFSRVMGLKLIAGQDFTEGMEPLYGNQDDFIRKVLVNETAVRTWGFQRNEDAVGRVVTSPGGQRFYVLGVLEDFNWSSVHHATDPVMLWNTPNNRFMTIRFASGADVGEAIAEVKGIYNRLFPMDVFHYEFADEVYNKQYREDEKFADLFGIFSGMAIVIASLGLFGLSAFSAERRSREVGIRKVLGANVRQLIGLLSKEFVLLVLIAFVIASPVAWLVMGSWLETFAFRMGLDATPFVITAIGSVLIAVITVSWKSLAVANLNPVNTLRSE
jgi:putative ABC transport system permease protein